MDSATPYKLGWIQKAIKFFLSIVCLQLIPPPSPRGILPKG